MKTLKESILNRSSHGAKGFDAQRREMIEKWLEEYKIKNYTINDDFTIDVNGNVFLSREDFKEFPEYIQFGIIRGGFYCSLNHIAQILSNLIYVFFIYLNCNSNIYILYSRDSNKFFLKLRASNIHIKFAYFLNITSVL